MKVVAPTGSAAVVVQGSTVQSFLGMCFKDGDDDLKESNFVKISNDMRDQMKAMTLVIIDEVSMIQPWLMGQIGSRLSTARECHTHLFGGLHIVFAGDLYQLPPVRASPLFTPVQNYKVSPGGLTLSGHAIWQNELNSCILLQESVRFVQDPTWGKINEEIRQGHWTKEIVDAINTRYIDDPDERAKCLRDLLLDTSDFIPIVVTSNRDRVKYNNHMIALSIEKLTPSNKAVRLAAVVKISTRSRQRFFNKRDLKMIYAMSSE